jgi:serine protease Do
MGRFLDSGWAILAFAAFACVAAAAPVRARSAPDSFAGVVQRLSPAVVNISTTQAVSGKTPQPPVLPEAPEGSPLAGLLGRQREMLTGGSAGPAGQSLGSGFLVDADGYIVTNLHVIAGAQGIVVTLHSGQRLVARLAGTDARTDLALLKVEARQPLPFVTFGDSDKAQPGDWAVVIGNPYGFGGSVSAGIISARNRELNLGSYDDFIQTDAAINSGNSGGPLFNLDGEVIGVNSALLSPSGGSVGIGFAISSNLARPVIAQLREYGETRRGWIGVRVQTVTPEIAESIGLAPARGALVNSVTPAGPAGRAGLAPGDIVLSFDGREIADMRAFPRTVAESAIGRRAPVIVFRRGKTITLSVGVERLAADERRVAQTSGGLIAPARARPAGTGMTFAALSPDLRARFGVPDGLQGVLVAAVDPGSTASENDVRPGDVIVEAGQAPVRTVEDLRAHLALARSSARRVTLFGLSRRGELLFKALRTGI